MRGLMIMTIPAVLMSVSCGERLQPTVLDLGEGGIPAQESWRSTITFSDSARITAVLWAGYIAVFTDKEYTLMDDSVHVDFFNEQEQHTSELTSQWGRVNDRTRDFAAYERVVVVSDDGSVLKTDSLFWNSRTQKIETDAFVEIISPREHIKGHGLVSDQSLKDYRIFKVTGEAVVKEE
jgi:LPS export ABC transporter protein LptC